MCPTRPIRIKDPKSVSTLLIFKDIRIGKEVRHREDGAKKTYTKNRSLTERK